MNFELSISNTTSTQKPKGMEIARLQFQRKSINLDILHKVLHNLFIALSIA